MGTNVASLTQRWNFRNLITSPGPQCCSVDSGHVLRSQDNLALGWVMGRAAYTWTQAPDASPMTAVRPLRHRPGCTVLLGCPWQRGRLVKPPPTLEVAGVKNSNYIIKTVKQMPERTGNKRISKGQADTLSLLHEGQHETYRWLTCLFTCKHRTCVGNRHEPRSTLGVAGDLAPSYLAPGVSSAVLGQTGCTRSSSCASRIPVSPTALWRQEVRVSARYRMPDPKRHAVYNTAARWHWAGIFKCLVSLNFRERPCKTQV